MCAAESSVERVSLKPTEKVKWDHVHLAYSDSEFLKLKKFKVAATHKLAAEKHRYFSVWNIHQGPVDTVSFKFNCVQSAQHCTNKIEKLKTVQ